MIIKRWNWHFVKLLSFFTIYDFIFPNRNFFQIVLQKKFLELSFPQKSCQRMTIQISLKRNDWGLPYWTMMKAICRGRTFRFWNFQEFGVSSIFNLSVQLLVLSIQETLKWYPFLFRPSSCDTDYPCSEKTTWESESSFPIFPRSITGPLHFWSFVCDSQLTEIHHWSELFRYVLIPCFIDHFWFISDFCQIPRRNFLKFFPSFCTPPDGSEYHITHTKTDQEKCSCFSCRHLSCNMTFMILL